MMDLLRMLQSVKVFILKSKF